MANSYRPRDGASVGFMLCACIVGFFAAGAAWYLGNGWPTGQRAGLTIALFYVGALCGYLGVAQLSYWNYLRAHNRREAALRALQLDAMRRR